MTVDETESSVGSFNVDMNVRMRHWLHRKILIILNLKNIRKTEENADVFQKKNIDEIFCL